MMNSNRPVLPGGLYASLPGTEPVMPSTTAQKVQWLMAPENYQYSDDGERVRLTKAGVVGVVGKEEFYFGRVHFLRVDSELATHGVPLGLHPQVLDFLLSEDEEVVLSARDVFGVRDAEEGEEVVGANQEIVAHGQPAIAPALPARIPADAHDDAPPAIGGVENQLAEFMRRAEANNITVRR